MRKNRYGIVLALVVPILLLFSGCYTVVSLVLPDLNGPSAGPQAQPPQPPPLPPSPPLIPPLPPEPVPVPPSPRDPEPAAADSKRPFDRHNSGSAAGESGYRNRDPGASRGQEPSAGNAAGGSSGTGQGRR
jgi:hypothetical protein